MNGMTVPMQVKLMIKPLKWTLQTHYKQEVELFICLTTDLNCSDSSSVLIVPWNSKDLETAMIIYY